MTSFTQSDHLEISEMSLLLEHSRLKESHSPISQVFYWLVSGVSVPNFWPILRAAEKKLSKRPLKEEESVVDTDAADASSICGRSLQFSRDHGETCGTLKSRK